MRAAASVQDLLKQGEEYYDADQLAEAIGSCDAVLAREPSNVKALRLKARAFADLGDNGSAILSYDRALAADPGNALLFLDKARLLGATGDLRGALETIARALELDPGSADYHSQRVQLLRRAGLLQEALSECDRWLEHATAKRGDSLVQKAAILRELGNFDEAFHTVSDASGEFGANDWTRWADTLRFEGKHTEAVRYYEKALELDAGFASAWRGKGLSLAAERRYEEALAAYARGAEADPKDAVYRVDEGNVYFELKRFKDAIAAYEAALDIEAGNQYALTNIGLVHEQLAEPGKAIEHYKRALETDANFLPAVLRLGWTLHLTGESASALETYDRALTLQADSFDALNSKGFILTRKGKPEEALELFDRAMQSPDRNGDRAPWVNKARALRDLKRYDECEACLREALEGAEGADRTPALASLGSFLAEVRFKEAEGHACFVEAHEIAKGSPDTKANLAESFLRLGRYQEAEEYAVAAAAAYEHSALSCVLRFVVLASRLLARDVTGAGSAFAEFTAALRRWHDAPLRDDWDFTNLAWIAANKGSDPLVRFLLMTLVDVQTGKLAFGGATFFDATAEPIAARSGALAAAN